MKRFFEILLRVVFVIIVLVLLTWGVYQLALKPWQTTWGATAVEAAAALPGDDLITNPQSDQTTRAITIHATPEQIWLWLVQMGADKGGLYTYEWLERMIQCRNTNADRIHSEWQQLNLEDIVTMCPGSFGPPPYQVAQIVPGQALVIGHHPLSEAEMASGLVWTDSWAFVLQPVDAQITRLVVRNRAGFDAPWRHWIEFGSFIMERGMLRGIRNRAE